MTDTNPSNSADRPSRPGSSNQPARRKERRRKLPAAGLAISGLLVVVLAGAVWLGVRAVAVRDNLNAAMELTPKLEADIQRDDTAAAAETVKAITGRTSKAREATADPLWSAAGLLPWIGPNFAAASAVAQSADDVIQRGAAPLVGIFQTLDWKALAPKADGLDLAPLTTARPVLAEAAASVRVSSERLNAVNANAVLPQISVPLTKARNQLAKLSTDLDAADNFASIAPGMLGAQGPRSYLLMVQNNAEARATGGIPGALAKLTIDKGKMSLSSETSAGALGEFSPPLGVDPEQERIYSERLGTFMQDVNLTPDFPTAADVAHRMWEQKTGERLDGVISVDPVALGYVLDATGPVRLEDPALNKLAAGSLPTELSGKNVVRTLLSDVYFKISNPALQDAYFAGVAKEIFGAISQGTADPKSLINALAKATEERRILLWSAAAPEQSLIAEYPLSGSISGASVPPNQFGVYWNDGTGAKMDYYIKRTAQLTQECMADGSSNVKLLVTSTNTAPSDAAKSLPAYVTGGGVFGVPAGTAQSNVVAYGPAHAHIESVLQNGVRLPFVAQQQAMRPVGTVTDQLAPGESSTLEFSFTGVAGDTQPSLVATPTVQPVIDVVHPVNNGSCPPAK